MFMNTMAVGPLDDIISCVTGGTTVAIARLGGAAVCWAQACREPMALTLAIEEGEVYLHSCEIGFRNAIFCAQYRLGRSEDAPDI